jgi:hypothetical protein
VIVHKPDATPQQLRSAGYQDARWRTAARGAARRRELADDLRNAPCQLTNPSVGRAA